MNEAICGDKQISDIQQLDTDEWKSNKDFFVNWTYLQVFSWCRLKWSSELCLPQKKKTKKQKSKKNPQQQKSHAGLATNHKK